MKMNKTATKNICDGTPYQAKSSVNKIQAVLLSPPQQKVSECPALPVDT
jgi:hypothetical protein